MKRRRAIGAALGYLIAAWLAIEVATTVEEPLSLPAWTDTLIIVLAISGFPIALVVSWLFDLTPGRLIRTEEDEARRSTAETSPPDAPPRRERGIAVLPFANISPDPQDEYFADGITEEIIADLSAVRSLRVISRTSVSRFKGAQRDLREIARLLDVDYILEGSVRKAGEDLRITAQLVDGRDDAHVWAEKYSGSLGQVFEFQERVSRSIVQSLRLRLSAEEQERLSGRPIEDPAAFDLYLRAREELWSFTPEGLARAAELAWEGLERTGENERLLYILGAVEWQHVNFCLVPAREFPDRLDAAEAYALRIFGLDGDSPRGHLLMGEIANNRARPLDQVTHFRSAAEGDPSHADAALFYAWALGGAGVVEEARRYAGRSVRLDPLAPLPHWICAWVELHAGNHERALELVTRAVDVSGEVQFVRWLPGVLLAQSGRLEEAIDSVEGLDAVPPSVPADKLNHFLLRAWQGRREEALTLAAELRDWSWWDDIYAWYMADGHALLGEIDTALEWAARMVELGLCSPAFLLEHDACLEPLRSDPRFGRVVARARDLSGQVAARVSAG